MLTLNSRRTASPALALCLMAVLTVTARAGTSADASAALQKALSGESIAAAAKMTSDPETLIGYALLVSPDRLRDELATRAAEVSPAHRKHAYCAVLVWDPREHSVDSLLKADPSNAYPHYLKATVLIENGKTADAIAALQAGNACAFFDSYTKELAGYALKALDTLHLDRETKLAGIALAATSRAYPFGPARIASLAERMGAQRQVLSKEEAGIAGNALITAADILLASPDRRRSIVFFAARKALTSAYLLKGTADPDDQASLAVASALAEGRRISLGERALRQVSTGLSLIAQGGAPHSAQEFLEQNPSIAEAAREPLARAIAEANEACDRLLNLAAASYYDAMATLALEGEFAAHKSFADLPDDSPILQAAQNVEGMWDRFRQIARDAGSVEYETNQRLKSLGLGLLMFSNDHEGAFPPDLDSLVRDRYVKDASGIVSPMTGRQFIYAGAGKRDNDPNLGQLVVAYEETPVPDTDLHIVLYGDSHTMRIRAEALAGALAAQAR